MIAILGGMGAALGFCATTLSYARLARMLPPYVVVSWVMLVGLVITVPLVALGGIPDGLDAGAGGWLALGGFGNVGGLLLSYHALRTGKVAVIAPIVSTEGAIAAVFAVATGEKLAAASAVTLAVIVVGIIFASREHTAQTPEHAPGASRGILPALLAAVAFGASLYAVGRVGRELPVAWALLPARAVGVGVVALPLWATSRLRLTRSAAPYILAGGIFEVIGISAYTVGARHGLAVSAVLASQFGALAAVAGFAFFRERLSRIQVVGVVVIAVGVAVLSALQA